MSDDFTNVIRALDQPRQITAPTTDVMPNSVHGIPSKYKGVWFRSRLEARWAAFFDRARWPWTYEPLELPGWIPDFAILKDYELQIHPTVAVARRTQMMSEERIAATHDNCSGIVPRDLLIEVKPALSWPALSIHRNRIDRSRYTDGAVLLVGAAVPIGVPQLGIGQLKWAGEWGPAQVGWCEKACAGRLTVLTPRKTCLLCAQSLLGETHRTRATSVAAAYFKEAGNDTQWRQST